MCFRAPLRVLARGLPTKSDRHERGPSKEMSLHRATDRDAADPCSLSRIWGSIHPPADDIPGRLIGERIGIDAFRLPISHDGLR